MDPRLWLENALEELLELALEAAPDQVDAWRAGVLITRLLDAPDGPLPPEALVARRADLIAVAVPPNVHQLLDRLADELNAIDDPLGPLLDVLIDLDDTVSVLSAIGEQANAGSCAGRAAGMVSLFPERVLVLGDFAEMRLATLRASSTPAALLWQSVEQAPAILLANSLPILRGRRPKAGQPTRTSAWLRVPEIAYQAAAHSGTLGSLELPTVQGSVRGWLESEKGRLGLELHSVGAAPRHAHLVAYRVGSAVRLNSFELTLNVKGRTAYADLGPVVGAENALHALVAGTGLTADELEIELEVADE